MKRTGRTSRVFQRSRLRHAMPVMIWLLAVGAVAGLFRNQSRRFEILGVAQGPVRNVATNVPGRLVDVSVRLFDQVRQGQIVAVVNAVLDDEYLEQQLRARLSTIVAEIAHLSAQLLPAQEDLEVAQSDREAARIADLRRFDVDVDNARLRVLELNAQLGTSQLLRENLAREIRVTEELVEKGALVPYERDKLLAQQEAANRQIEETQRLLERASLNFDQAQERRRTYVANEPELSTTDSRLEVIRRAIAVQEHEMQEVNAQLAALEQRRGLELLSPLTGVVSHIWHGPGEAVTPGDPIITVAQTRPEEVVGYARRDQAWQLKQDMEIDLIRTADPLQIVRAQVVHVGPTVEQMPAALWANPNVPQWGRPFKVEVPENLALLPGEVVGIRGP